MKIFLSFLILIFVSHCKNNIDCELANEKAFSVVFSERDYDKALKLIENCQDQKSLFLKSKIYFKQEKYVDALDIMDAQIKLAEDDHVRYFYKAILNFKIKDTLNFDKNINKALLIMQKKIYSNEYTQDDILNFTFYYLFKTQDKKKLQEELKKMNIAYKNNEDLEFIIENTAKREDAEMFFINSF